MPQRYRSLLLFKQEMQKRKSSASRVGKCRNNIGRFPQYCSYENMKSSASRVGKCRNDIGRFPHYCSIRYINLVLILRTRNFSHSKGQSGTSFAPVIVIVTHHHPSWPFIGRNHIKFTLHKNRELAGGMPVGSYVRTQKTHSPKI